MPRKKASKKKTNVEKKTVAETKTVSAKANETKVELKEVKDKLDTKKEEKVVKKAAAKKTVKETKAEEKPAKKAAVKTVKETKAEEKPAKKAAVKTVKETKAEEKPAKKAAAKTVKETKAEEKPAKKAAAKKTVKETKAEEKPAKKAAAKKTVKETKAEEKPAKKAAAKETVKETKAEEKPAKKAAAKKAVKETKAEEKPAKKAAAKKTVKETKAEEKSAKKAAAKKTVKETKAEEKPAKKAVKETKKEEKPVVEEVKVEPVMEEYHEELPQPRRSVAFIGSECYPFVKTGGLGDVMYALPKALAKQNCDVKVILPRYACIPEEYQNKMIYRGSFDMDLCADGKSYYVGIMEYVWDGVVYDFIDNQEFFTEGNPYTNLVDDIPKFCYFGKAALAALNYMNWTPDVIHCHDWQAGLVPIYLREMFNDTPLSRSKVVMTIHNLRFQGVYNIETFKYWTNLPDYVFNKDTLTVKWLDANMLKGGLTYANAITTVSNTYAGEIQTEFYGEGLDAHLRYHSGKLRGIVNGIDYDIWNSATDDKLASKYDITNVLDKKKENKRALQEELGLEQDDHKFVIGLISRLTDQKGLDLVNEIIPQVMDEHTQVVILGTGDPAYEDSFRYYENAYKGNLCSNIMYDESRAHRIYAGADALLVPSQFEPCGLTQLIAMHYGTVPIVRETGGLKDTVEPYDVNYNSGNGFTFDRYESGLLLDAINRAKTFYFTNRWCFDEMVQRNMAKDVSWENSAKQYRELYVELTK
ncbi:glycogen/starch synthase [Kandleria vitulina]|uniref:glycogen/starch synthase n=3 Tax=Kandleria vitulina TaxID=1630 RepID=UPI0009B92D35|nr:glycogen/starch synthase [Kandleria vitulina]